jgi:hypothetical protein
MLLERTAATPMLAAIQPMVALLAQVAQAAATVLQELQESYVVAAQAATQAMSQASK